MWLMQARYGAGRQSQVDFGVLGRVDRGLRPFIEPLAASVGVRPRVEGTNNLTPSVDSSSAMELETAGCPAFLRPAPAENEPALIPRTDVSIAVNRSIPLCRHGRDRNPDPSAGRRSRLRFINHDRRHGNGTSGGPAAICRPR